MSEEQPYPEYTPMREMPITASIPYIFRWKILNLKLMLNDIEYLYKTHKISTALPLYNAVCKEADEMCAALLYDITDREYKRARLHDIIQEGDNTRGSG